MQDRDYYFSFRQKYEPENLKSRYCGRVAAGVRLIFLRSARENSASSASAGIASGFRLAPLSALHRLGKIGEELVGQFLGRAIDQALAELGELAADLRLDIVAKQRAAILLGQRDDGAALGKGGNPSLALARNLVAVGRIEIAQHHLALEAG